MSEYKKALSILYGNSLIEAGKQSKEWITYEMAIEHNEPIVKANDLLKEAIEKAEKYDELYLGGGMYLPNQLKLERDEANKRCEELEEKVMQYESIRIEDVLTFEGTNGKYNNADYKCLYINALKRIEELEQQNKVLVDGVKALKNYCCCSGVERNLDLIEIHFFNPTYEEEPNDFEKIKAMLEVVDDEQSNN